MLKDEGKLSTHARAMLSAKSYTLFYLKMFFIIGGLYGIAHPFIVLNFFKMPVSMGWVQGAYQKKEAAALAIHEPKILLVAGSSVHFGLNAEMLQKEFHAPVVNFGVMASLDLDYILYRARKVLGQGDVVILPLEYSLYAYDPQKTYGDSRIFHLITFDQDFFLHNVSLMQKIRTFYRINPLMFIGSLYEQIRARSKNFQAGGSYQVNTINQFGDETAKNPHIFKAPPLQDLVPMTPDAVGTLKEFQQWCEKNGVKMYLTFSNGAYFKEYERPSFQKKIQVVLSDLRSHGFEIIGTPIDAMVDPSLMFDTEYHLTPEGILKRTTRFIELLQEIQLSSPKMTRG